MTLRRLFVTPVPDESRAAFTRDVPAVGARAAALVLALSVGGQLVQALGGTELHVAALRTSASIGLLLSLGWVGVGRGRSPLAMVFWPEAAALTLLAGVAFVLGSPAAATWFTVIVVASVTLSAMTIPHLSTVYGLVYPAHARARLVAYGRMVNGIVAVAAGWGFGRLFAADPLYGRVVFPAVAALGLVLMWRFYRMPVAVARRPGQARRRSAWHILRSDRPFRRFQAFQFLLGFANLSAIPIIDLYVRRELGLGIESAVLVVGHGVVMQAVILLTVRAQGGLFDRLGVMKLRVLTSAVLGLSLGCWAFADGLPMAILASVLAGLGMAGGQLIWMIGALSFARREELESYASIHTFLTGLRGLLAPAAGVLALNTIFEHDYRALLLTAAGLVFASALGHGLFVRLPAAASVAGR